MRNRTELIKQIKEFVSKNKTGKAIKLLADEQLSDIDRELILLNSRYSKLTEEKRLGIIDGDSAQLKLNKINFDLLALTELLDEQVAESEGNKKAKFSEKEPTISKKKNNQSSPVSTQNNTSKYLMIGVGVLIAAALGFWGFMQSSSEPTITKKPDVVKPKPPVKEEPTNEDEFVLSEKSQEAPFTPVLSGDDRIKEIYLGNHFEGGTIFYLDTVRKRGLIMATSDALDKEILWLDRPFEKARANHTGLFDGKKNTEKIVKKFGEGLYPAKICADFDDEGFTDWYLPSKDELNELYNYNNHEGFKKLYYWSSTELSDKHVYYRSFFNGRSYEFIPKGNPNNFNKQNKGKIRPIRRFKY